MSDKADASAAVPLKVRSLWRRRLEWSCRTGTACCLGVLLAIYSAADTNLAIPFFIPVIAITALNRNFGATLQSSYQISVGAVFGSLVGWLIVTALHFHGESMGVLLVLTNFIGVWLFLQTKSASGVIKLYLCANTLAVLYFVPNRDADRTWPFRVARDIILGCCCAIVAQLVPFPRFTVAVAKRRLVHTGRLINKVFQILITSYQSDNALQTEILRVKASRILQAADDNLRMLQYLINESQFEPRWPGTMAAIESRVQLLDYTLCAVKSMESALRATYPWTNPTHLFVVKHVKPSLDELVITSSRCMEHYLSLKPNEDAVRLAATESLTNLHKQFQQCRYHMFYSPDRLSDWKVSDVMLNNFVLFNIDDFVRPMVDPSCSFSIVPPDAPVPKSMIFQESHMPQHSRADSRQSVVDTTSRIALTEGSRWSSSLSPAAPDAPVCNCCSVCCTTLRRTVSWCARTLCTVLAWLWEYVSAPWILLWNAPSKSRLADMKNSFRVSLAMGLASLVVFVPELRVSQYDQGFWASLTVAFVYTPSLGGSFQQSMLRLQGTVVGGMFGYCAAVGVQEDPTARVLLLTFWAILSGYVRSSKNHAYAGTVSGFTACIIMLGKSPSGDVTDYALDRIVQTFIGLVLYLLVSNTFWPLRATTLLRNEVAKFLATSSEWSRARFAVTAASSTLTEPHSPTSFPRPSASVTNGHERAGSAEPHTPSKLEASDTDTLLQVLPPNDPGQSVVTAALRQAAPADEAKVPITKPFSMVSGTRAVLQTSLSMQSALLPQSAAEPELWWGTFPVEIYQALLGRQRSIYQGLIDIDRALNCLSLLNGDHLPHRVQLRLPFRSFAEKLVSVLDTLKNSLSSLSSPSTTESASGDVPNAVVLDGLVIMNNALKTLQSQFSAWIIKLIQDNMNQVDDVARNSPGFSEEKFLLQPKPLVISNIDVMSVNTLCHSSELAILDVMAITHLIQQLLQIHGMGDIDTNLDIVC